MQIVTDTGMDLHLPPDQSPEIEIHIVRHSITLDGKTYMSGADIEPEELQKMLMATSSFPTTSQPSSGDFAAMYKKLAATDPDILSIHMSSGLSGTVNAAHAGAEMTPEAHVTIVDTKTLCAALGWQVAAAARALKAGWPLDQILALIDRIGAASDSMYTLDDLKYLIHGGRISHMKGLIASVLKLRPMIRVETRTWQIRAAGNGAHLRSGAAGAGRLDAQTSPPRQRVTRAGVARLQSACR